MGDHSNRAENKLKKFIAEHAPCYIYRRNRIAENCEKLRSAFPEEQLLYSVKANPNMSVVNEVARHGFGADAASPGEVEIAWMAGIDSNRIQYSAPGRTAEDIRRAFGRCRIIADSFHELELIEQEAARRFETAEAGIRIHPAFGMDGETGAPSVFGIDEEQLDELPERLRYLSHIKITGLHIHLRSQILDAAVIAEYWRNCFELAKRVNELDGIDVRFINFGSGIGNVYDAEHDAPVDLEFLSEAMNEISRENSQTLKAELCIETGRFAVCSAGTYYTKIVDVKESRGRKYLIVNGGLNGFARPALANLLYKAAGRYPEQGMEPLYTSPGEFSVRILTDDQETETVTVTGNLCTAMDVIAENIELPRARIGDIIAVSNAGSYGYSLSPVHFADHSAPEQFLL